MGPTPSDPPTEPAGPLPATGFWERMRDDGRPLLLFVTHGMGGGVARHIGELAAALETRAQVLLLEGFAGTHVRLRPALEGGSGLWVPVAAWQRLVSLLRSLGVDRVHYHHVHGLPMHVLELPGALDCPHDVTLHDYYPACPAYHLKDGSLRFCGGLPGCGKCLEAGGAQWPLSIGEWRERFGRLLGGAARVIAPSRDCATRMQGFFPGISPRVWPHPQERDLAAPPPVRVLVPGAMCVEKGLDVLEACARDAAARALPLHFRVVGFMARPMALWPELPVTISGEYAEGELPALLALEHGDALLFPAQCPETYSYTLSAAIATGLPIVATRMGALGERLAGRRDCRLVSWQAPAGELNDALLSASPPRPVPAAPTSLVTASGYADAYIEPVTRRSRVLPDMPALDVAWSRPPAVEMTPAPLEWLFDDGVRAGRASSRTELRRRAREADAALVHARAQAEAASEEARRAAAEASAARQALAGHENELARLHARLQSLRAEAQAAASMATAAQSRLARLESSRSWRMLGPLRALARRLGLTRT